MARVRSLLCCLILVVLWAWPASGQEFIRLNPTSISDTISSSGDSVTLTNANVGGLGSVKVQTLDSYSGTWEVRCTLAGTVVDRGTITGASFDADAELKLSAWDGSSTVTSVTDSVGGWDVQNASGCRAITVIATAGFAASDTVVVISATQSGGGSGGGGGSTDVSALATEATLSSMAGDIATLASNISVDATHDSAVRANGPQIMGECDDTSTDPVDEGDAGRVRVDCTTRAMLTRLTDPCTGTKTYHIVNMSTATTVEIANAVSSQFFYICSVNLVAAAAQTIAIGEDDTDGCGSITAGLHGGATAATGWSFAANGGIALGNGTGTVMKTATAARYLCVITGQATQISGTIGYVSAP